MAGSHPVTDWSRIRAIVCDVDGTLTDGTVTLDDRAVETKGFCARDGMGISIWRSLGGKFGIITGRRSLALSIRLREIGCDGVVQGAGEKLAHLKGLCEQFGVSMEECAYVGDDLPDLAPVAACGVGVAVAGAVQEVISAARYVTRARPGSGAIREVVEEALKAQGRWGAVVTKFAECER